MGVVLFLTNQWHTGQRRRTFLLVLAVMLVFSFNCFAGDTSSVSIHFAFDDYSLNQEAQIQLNQLVKAASGTPADITIYGFTDQVGSMAYNKKLSFKRAVQVRDYLVKAGVRPGTFTTVRGKGKTELVSNQMDQVSRQKNRRVLVLVAYEGESTMQTTGNNGNKKDIDSNQPGQETAPPALTDRIKDSSVKTGDRIILRNINFEGGRHIFLPRSYSAMSELLNAMREIPALKIAIQGHICCEQSGRDGFDFDLGTNDLSVQRAKAVYEYLLENGINAARMSYEGFGSRYHIVKEISEEDRTTNRRVEIKIISK